MIYVILEQALALIYSSVEKIWKWCLQNFVSDNFLVISKLAELLKGKYIAALLVSFTKEDFSLTHSIYYLKPFSITRS